MLGPYPEGTRIKRLIGSLWNSGVTDGFWLSIGVFSERVAFADFAGGDFPFHAPSTAQPILGPLTISGAPAVACPSGPRLDMPLDFVMPVSGYIGIAIWDAASDQLCLFGLDVELPPEDQNEPQRVASPSSTQKPSSASKSVSKGPGGLRVKGRSPQPPQSPAEYPASQSTPEWNQ